MSEMNNYFFVSEIFLSYFKTNDWAKKYLYKKDYRITEMIVDILGLEFFDCFGKTMKECFRNKELLLRSKIYNPKQNNICLFQVWKNASCRNLFLEKVQESKFKKAIYRKDIQFKELIREKASEEFIQKKIEEIKPKEVIWQFVDGKFQKNWMILGDPLKE